MKERSFSEIQFEELADSFDKNDELGVEDTQAEMHEHWKNYIEAGCDAGLIVRMMSPGDLYKNFDYLRSKGVKINISDLANRLYEAINEKKDDFSSYSITEVFQEGITWWLERGLSITELAKINNDFVENMDKKKLADFGIDKSSI